MDDRDNLVLMVNPEFVTHLESPYVVAGAELARALRRIFVVAH